MWGAPCQGPRACVHRLQAAACTPSGRVRACRSPHQSNGAKHWRNGALHTTSGRPLRWTHARAVSEEREVQQQAKRAAQQPQASQRTPSTQPAPGAQPRQPAPNSQGLSSRFAAAINEAQPPKAPFFEAGICRLYYFSEPELHVVRELVDSMKNCRAALTLLAVASILLTITQLQAGEHVSSGLNAEVITASGLTIGDVAFWADGFMVAALISYSVGPFERVMRSRSNQMAYCFQGVNRLALIFQQLSIGSVAVSTVTGLEAAAKYPPLVTAMAALFFGVAVVRSAAMWWTLTRHTQNNEEIMRTLGAIRNPQCSAYTKQMSLWDRWAVFLAFGYLLQYEEKSTSAASGMPADTDAAAAAALVPTAMPAVAAVLPISATPAVASAVPASTMPAMAAPMPTTATPAMTAATSTMAAATPAVTSTTDVAAAALLPGSERLGFEGPVAASSIDGCTENPNTYEFSEAEERVLRGLTEAANTAGLALGLQAFVTLMLTIADVGVDDLPDAISNGITMVNKLIMAGILFNACASYDRALHTVGCNDVRHLMDGLGHKGLTGLFDSLAVLSWAITLATLAGLALPLVEENVLARFVGDGLSHKAADAIIEALEYAVRVLRGL